jgi:hypothetical protein
MKDLLREIRGHVTPRLDKHGVTNELVEELLGLSHEEQEHYWEQIEPLLDSWEDACGEFGLEPSPSKLKDYLLGELEPISELPPLPVSGEVADICFVGHSQYTNEMVRMIRKAKDSIVFNSYVLGSTFGQVKEHLTEAVEDEDNNVELSFYLDKRETKWGRGYENKRALALWKAEGWPKATKPIQINRVETHAKCMIVDRKWVLVGSSNFDRLKSPIYQANVRFCDEAIANNMLQSLLETT